MWTVNPYLAHKMSKKHVNQCVQALTKLYLVLDASFAKDKSSKAHQHNIDYKRLKHVETRIKCMLGAS